MHKSLFTLISCLFLSACFQVQLRGPVAGSSITIEELSGGQQIAQGQSWDESFLVGLNGQAAWDGYGASGQLWLLGVYLPQAREWEDQRWYLMTASGGLETDSDGNQLNDSAGQAVSGSWRALISGADAKRRGAKISPLTEAIYQYLSPNLANLSDDDLSRQLDLLARRLVSDVDGDGEVDYFDALRWSRLFDADKLMADEDLLNQISDSLAAGDSDIRALAVALVDSGEAYDGEWVYRFARPDGNSYTCAHCHARVEPATNGFARPGHPLGDATGRSSYKDGQLTELIDAANSCLDEWMNAEPWDESSSDWLALEAWLDSHAPPGVAKNVDIQITTIPNDLSGGDASAGRETFNTSCAICHAQDGAGSLQAPAIGGFGYNAEYVANRVRNSGRTNSEVYEGLTGGIMPFWGANRFSDAELLNVVAFLGLGADELDAISGDTTGGASTSNCGSDHERVGWETELITRQHRVSGTARIIDNCTIEITNFNYDGRGIVVQAYTGSGNDFFGAAAGPISPDLVGTAYENATVRFTLPDNRSLDSFDAISIWCVEVGVSFGDGIFEPPGSG